MAQHPVEWLRATRLSTTLQRQSGYATVELALTIPILLMVSAVCVWLLSMTVTDLRLHSAASSAVRILARGEGLPQGFSQSLPAQAQYEVVQEGKNVRVSIRMHAHSPIPALPLPITLSATAVAAREDAFSDS